VDLLGANLEGWRPRDIEPSDEVFAEYRHPFILQIVLIGLRVELLDVSDERLDSISKRDLLAFGASDLTVVNLLHPVSIRLDPLNEVHEVGLPLGRSEVLFVRREELVVLLLEVAMVDLFCLGSHARDRLVVEDIRDSGHHNIMVPLQSLLGCRTLE
jgi:hypothetical protein